MSEIAIVSSKRARLLQMADTDGSGARRALALAAEPTRFLSSVQVGITSIGILNGAIGEASIASRVETWLERVPALAPYADALSLGIMVILLTYVSLILGELVPKRLALTDPEAVASAIARPMTAFAAVGRPIVSALSLSTDAVQRAIGDEPAALADDAAPPRYRTLAGLAMLTLERVPRTGDNFKRGPFRIEVVDMDGRRVDRALVAREPMFLPRRSEPACSRLLRGGVGAWRVRLVVGLDWSGRDDLNFRPLGPESRSSPSNSERRVDNEGDGFT